MYGQQHQPPKPGNGRVWPAKERRTQNSPHFTGNITLPDGRQMRVSLWESYANRGSGPFNGFSIKLSEDTRQNGGYQAQGGYGQPQSYGQGYQPQGNGHAPQGGPPQPPHGQGGYGQGYYGGVQPPAPPASAYGPGDEGYVPGFDD